MGLGLNVNEPTGIMVVDIGADTTEISIISLGGLVISHLLHLAGTAWMNPLSAISAKTTTWLSGAKQPVL